MATFFPPQGPSAHATQHMSNQSLSQFLRPTNTTIIVPRPTSRAAAFRYTQIEPLVTPRKLAPLPLSPRDVDASPMPKLTPPLTGCRTVALPWSMGYWGSHNVYTQPGSYSEDVSAVPYNRYTPRAKDPPKAVYTPLG